MRDSRQLAFTDRAHAAGVRVEAVDAVDSGDPHVDSVIGVPARDGEASPLFPPRVTRLNWDAVRSGS